MFQYKHVLQIIIILATATLLGYVLSYIYEVRCNDKAEKIISVKSYQCNENCCVSHIR
jgi:hypothetical protein